MSVTKQNADLIQDLSKELCKVGDWAINVSGESEFQKGARAGIESVLGSIRENSGEMSLWGDEDGTFTIMIGLLEEVYAMRDLADIVLEFNGGGNTREALAAYLRQLAKSLQSHEEAKE